MALVRSVARRYAGRGETLEDLVQVGAIGLIKASDRFDPTRGVAFATFATPSIEGAIRNHLRDRVSSLRIPRELHQKSGELHQRSGELEAALGRSPTLSELASSLDADERDLERVLSADRARQSIPISAGDDRLELPDHSTSISGSEDRLLLADSLRTLDERERRIVLLRFHADLTEREIARELGISQAHVSRLLGGALAKLREDLGSPGGDPTGGDITSKAAISPVAEQKRTRRELDGSGTRGSSGREHARDETRLGHVGASQEGRTLEHYLELPYQVAVKSELDGDRHCWTATVLELPGCTAQGATQDEAVALLRVAMEAWLSDALADQREIPVPESKRAADGLPGREPPRAKPAPSHSGRFLVRMPHELHEQLARAAEDKEVSLNRFVTDALAASLSPGQPVDQPSQQPSAAPGPVEEVGPPSSSPSQRGRALRFALATNLVVVVLAGLVAVVLLVLALEHGI